MSLPLGKYFGIPAYLHISWFFMWLFVYWADDFNTRVFYTFPLVYFFVLLHEYGHALMAKTFKVNTESITLMALGGIARLKMGFLSPRAEFWITAAGPMVNLVCGTIAGWIMWLGEFDNDFINTAYFSNLALVIFNLIPAFPMDGGRILRSLGFGFLWKNNPKTSPAELYFRATKYSVWVSRVLSLLLLILFLAAMQPAGVLIAVFVFLIATRELQGARDRMETEQEAVDELVRECVHRLGLSRPLSDESWEKIKADPEALNKFGLIHAKFSVPTDLKPEVMDYLYEPEEECEPENEPARL